MSNSVGDIYLDLNVNKKAFGKQINGMKNSASSTLGPLVGKLGAALGVAVGVGAMAKFGASCVKLGSDLAEVQNVVDVTYPNMSKKVNDFASNAISSIGLSETVTKKYMGTLGAMSKSFGFTEKQSYGMAKGITQLAGDVSSFYNISSDEAMTKLKSVWTGETESIKELGVVMTQNALDQYAMQNGYGKTTAKMTEQEKVALRYQYVMDKLSLASGDFIRTSGGWANQTRVLKLQFDQLKASVGQGLISALLPAIRMLNLLLSKLNVVAKAFQNFMQGIFGKVNTSSKAATSAIGDTSVAASNAAGKASKAAGTAAKKAAKATKGTLANFDQLNNISSNKSDDTGDTGTGDTGIGGGLDDTSTAADKADEKAGKLSKTLQEILKLVGEIGKSFTTGLFDKLNTINTKKLVDAFSKVKDVLVNIVTDADVDKAAFNFVNSYAKTIGSSIGTFIALGADIVTNIVSGIGNSLEENKDFIKQRLVSMFNTGIKFNNIIQSVNDFLTEIGSLLTSDTAIGITSDIMSIFEKGFFGATDLATKFSVDVVDLITSPFLNNKDKITKAIENTLSPIKTVTESIKELVSDVVDKALGVYNQYITPAFENFKQTFTDVFGSMLDAYNKYLVPVLKNISEDFSKLVKKDLKPVITGFEELVGKIVKCVSDIFKALTPLMSWIAGTFVKNFASALQKIWDGFKVAFNAIAGIVKGIIKVISGVIDMIDGIVTGDWKKVWNGFKNVVSGVCDIIISVIKAILVPIKSVLNSLIGFFEGMVNGFVTGINTMLSALNKLKVKIPKALGGGSLGFNIDLIKKASFPKLANGGFVKANTPQLVTVGDNRTQGEIVSPEDKLQAMADKAAAKATAGIITKQELYDTLVTIINLFGLADKVEISGDSDGIFKVIQKKAKSFKNTTGKLAFE